MNRLDETFKTTVALGKSRFQIWKILIANKKTEDLLVTFEDDDGRKYCCLELNKLLSILYGVK